MDKLKSHITTHGNTKRTKKCSHCQQIFSNATILQRHLYEIHNDEASRKKIKCFECQQTFKLEKQRRIHHERCHGISHYIDGTSMKSLPLLENKPSEMKISSNYSNPEFQQDNIIVYIEAD